MKKNNILKTSIVCEGEMERMFLIFLKDKLYKSKHPICKQHSQTIGGTIKLDNINKDGKNCCKKFYVFDKDDLEELMINKIKSKVQEHNQNWIFSIPQMEVCLLAIFEKCGDKNIDKIELEAKLTNHIKKNGIFSNKYEHTVSNLEKILKYLKNKIEDENDEYEIDKYEENLEHYSKNKQIHTNLIEYIKYLNNKKRSY